MFSFQDTDKFKLFEENYGNFRKIDFLCTISICFTFFVVLSLISRFLYVLKKKRNIVYILRKKIYKNNLFLSNLQIFSFFQKRKSRKTTFFSNLQLLSIFQKQIDKTGLATLAHKTLRMYICAFTFASATFVHAQVSPTHKTSLYSQIL